MQHERIAALERAIRETHGGKPVFRFVTLVTAPPGDRRAWSGAVYVFDLEDHPNAQRCYGVACPTDADSDGLVTILGTDTVTSAEAAVRVHLADERGRLQS